jgi:hypothetical protein
MMFDHLPILLKHYILKALSLPPHVTVKKSARRIRQMVSETLMRRGDEKTSSYANEFPTEKLLSYFQRIPAEQLLPHAEKISCVTKHYLDHRFDLLGSGWAQVKHGMRCRGLEGYRYDMGSPVEADSAGKWLEGRINSSNLDESKRIWRLVENGYTPIDWHIDFKSGYRWPEKTWYKAIKFGHKLGVDVKVPWELSRMQHLPQMAMAYAFGAGSSKLKAQSNGDNIEKQLQNQKPKNEQLEKAERYVREFRNQVLDFVASNPPRFGVNWVCAMDVAIRAANWIVAYNVFREAGAEFDEGFETVFARSLYEHGTHIVGNLEWQNGQRGNHYLADIAGLAFIAAHLDAKRETDAWLAFAVHELVQEVGYQFYPDGGNFEGSTAYHRLSSEMVYFATALVLGLPKTRLAQLKYYDHTALKARLGKPTLKPGPLPFYRPPEGSKVQASEIPFPEWFFERMERMAEFIMDITKPNGHIPQIGDNDSGRFFKLGPNYECMKVKEAKEKYANLDGYNDLPDDAEYYMEDHLDCSHLVAAGYGLFGREDFSKWLGGAEKAASIPDFAVIKTLLNDSCIGSQRFQDREKEDSEFFSVGNREDFQEALETMQSLPADQVETHVFSSHKGDLTKDLIIRAYSDFGLYLYTSPLLYLAIRCWPGRKPYHAGHMHRDQLSIELVIDDEQHVSDPGTYLYEPLPGVRNRYRSQMAHFSPWTLDEEPAPFGKSVFRMRPPAPATPYYFGPRGFWSKNEHENKKRIAIALRLNSQSVNIHHWILNRIGDIHMSKAKPLPFSMGYGLCVRVSDKLPSILGQRE